MTITEKRLELLNDTVNHFNSTNRAFNGHCYYSHLYKGGCAIGRRISTELANKLDRYSSIEYNNDTSIPAIFSLLPTDLQTLGQGFLMEIQKLHDEIENWNKNGLSDKGVEFVAQIRQNYCSVGRD